MIFRDSKGRECDITETEVCDSHVVVIKAVYLDDTHNEPEQLNETELDYIQSHYQDYLSQRAFEHQSARAYDHFKDLYKYGE